MKDYKLSEIKEICQKTKDCDDCECEEFCQNIKYSIFPSAWGVKEILERKKECGEKEMKNENA